MSGDSGPDVKVSWLGCLGCTGTVCGCLAMIAITVKLFQVLW